MEPLTAPDQSDPVGLASATGPQWLVGIGSSAGGVEALRELLPGLPGGDVAYVIAQHMSPVHPSLLLEVLSRESELELSEITDGLPLRAGTIFVSRPNCDVEVSSGRFRTRQASPRISPQPSIDVLLRSLARVGGDHAIAVILSGTGADGTAGAEAIRIAGGRSVAQDLSSARYRDMPAAAIDAGFIDYVRRPDEIGALLTEIMAGGEPAGSPGRFANDPAMASLARETLLATGWNLAAYKSGTLGRQLDKRVAALGLSSRQDYLAYVEEHPAELATLRDSMLINVTSFLRDRAAFDSLRSALQPLVAAKIGEQPLRGWVAGCATGEEAYSVAMLLAEVNRESGSDRGVKVLATDISDAAMDIARRGVYPVDSLAHVPQEWIDRYFTVSGKQATVSKWLRDTLVIARQDITRDPPLVRMDLVSCRNLLIYLVPEVQQRVMTNLHAALNPRGLLFLGRSETVPADSGLFTTISAGNRIFQRLPGRAATTLSTSAIGRELPDVRSRTSTKQVARDRMRDDVRDLVLSHWGPPALLIDAAGVPVHQVGNVGRFLSLPDPNGDFTILSMILPELRTEMSTLLGRLNRDGASTATHTIMLRSEDGSSESLVIHASRITPGGQAESYVLIAFVPAPAPTVLAAPDVHAPLDQEESIEVLHSQLAALREELAGTREHLQAVIEELESSNEELQAMNEELQASSEELQATNEELETTNEELQATNEELTTVNETLQVRTTELSETNEILRNNQMAVNTEIVLVDRTLRVLQFSPLAVKVIGLVPEDIGTPLELLPSHVDISELAVLVRKVLATGEGQIVETSTSTAGYFMQVVPYVKNDTLVGAVIALSDITELRETRLEAERKSALLKGIFTMAGTPMAWLGEDGSIRQCNADLLNLIGRKEVELVGKTPTDLVLPGYRDHVSTALAAVGAGREPSVRMTVELVGGTQELLSVDMTLARLEGPDRSQRVLLATFHDLTAAHSAHAALEAREQQLEAVFSGTGAPMALCDTDGLISRANPALCDILGYGPAEIRGTRLDDITYPDDVDADATMFNALAAGKRATYQIDKRFLKKDGGIIWGREVVSLSHTPEPDNPPFVIATVLDITAERQREAAALAQAQSDPLTGLANRILAFDRLRQATLRTQRTLEAVFVLLIDLNGFKGINDRLGHEIGDEVLKETAHRIESAVRETDTVARIGGDEFLVIASEDPADAGHEVLGLSERIIESVRRPMDIPGGPRGLVVTASIGLAHCPTDGFDVEELVRKADVAMYASKREGGDGISIYSNRLSDQARRTARLRSEVLQGLEEHTFVPYLQPIVRAGDRSVYGFEVLARWHHPERGTLAPNDFLDLIYEFRQLTEFTRLIVEQAATAAGRLRSIAPDLELFINVDPHQLSDGALADMLGTSIGPDLTGWCIEITETTHIGSDPAIRRTLDALKSRGARSALDDFGTGYSSVMSLKSLGFDEVKIDREFVADVDREDVRSLVATMVSMAEALGAETVGEGVETDEQAAALSELGVDYLQGYLFSRPVSVDDAVAWLEQHQRGHG